VTVVLLQNEGRMGVRDALNEDPEFSLSDICPVDTGPVAAYEMGDWLSVPLLLLAVVSWTYFDEFVEFFATCPIHLEGPGLGFIRDWRIIMFDGTSSTLSPDDFTYGQLWISDDRRCIRRRV